MEIPLAREVNQQLEALGVAFLGPEDEVGFHEKCREFRGFLINKDNRPNRPKITRQSYWDIDTTYQYDVLQHDIFRISNQLAYAIGFTSIYLPYVVKREHAYAKYFPTIGDGFFWYHSDFGFRLAASGWDRLALLLDMALNLGLSKKASLDRVLKEAAKNSTFASDAHVSALERFRNGKYREIVEWPGKGIRDEATHTITRATRAFLEFLGAYGESAKPQVMPDDERTKLIEHLALYIEGISRVAKIVQAHWRNAWGQP